MKNFVLRLRKIIKFYTDKRFSTIAGTLVYFLLMSLAPFIVWLTLLLGNADLEQFLSSALFEALTPFLTYLKNSAQTAASGAGIILLATSLYSSTNFFYHLRRSGEIVYGSAMVKGGIKLRILSALLIIVTIFFIAFLAAVMVTGRWILIIFMPEILCDIISVVFVTMLTFFIVILMNLFACPYRLSFNEVFSGSILTTILWILFVLGFTVYIRYASPGKLYGAIASVIIFLLWCYFMMCCFVIGMIRNGAVMKTRKYKKLF